MRSEQAVQEVSMRRRVDLDPPSHAGQRRRIECTTESDVPFFVTIDGMEWNFFQAGQALELEGREVIVEGEAAVVWKVVRIERAGHA